MANVKLSDLDAASALDGTEVVPMVQDATTVVATVEDIRLMPSFATGSRPTAAVAGAGAVIYDSTLGKPIYSDGTNWKLFADDTNA